MDYELLLFDRLNVIKDIISKYGEEKFFISFSGGKDSTILHYLVDMAIPDNKIPRVFINTGIEYNDIVAFVKELASKDERFVILKPTQNIRKVLETYGYPFKSKEHSDKVAIYQHGHSKTYVNKYLTKTNGFGCPAKLRYQFTEENKLKISRQCCFQLKKKPAHKWQTENNRPITMTGMHSGEGKNRDVRLQCVITDKDGNAIKFHPMSKVNTEWEEWFVETYHIQLCKLYYPPYSFERTGCKGCPYNIKLQKDLDIMEQYLPNEKRQCESIWKPVYEEYRRLNYRLDKNRQMSIDDYFK